MNAFLKEQKKIRQKIMCSEFNYFDKIERLFNKQFPPCTIQECMKVYKKPYYKNHIIMKCMLCKQHRICCLHCNNRISLSDKFNEIGMGFNINTYNFDFYDDIFYKMYGDDDATFNEEYYYKYIYSDDYDMDMKWFHIDFHMAGIIPTIDQYHFQIFIDFERHYNYKDFCKDCVKAYKKDTA